MITMAGAEEIQAQLGYELAVYREQIAMIKRETERVSLTTIDLANALRTVERLSAETALIPIGGGAMIRGTISNTRAVDVSIHAVVPVSVYALSVAKAIPDVNTHKISPQPVAVVIFFIELLHIIYLI